MDLLLILVCTCLETTTCDYIFSIFGKHSKKKQLIKLTLFSHIVIHVIQTIIISFHEPYNLV